MFIRSSNFKAILIFTLGLALAAVSAFALPPVDFSGSRVVGGLTSLDAETYFDANNLLMFVTNRGGLAEDWNLFLAFRNNGFYYPYSGNCNDIVNGTLDKTVLYSAGLCLGGLVNGEIRLAVGAYSTPEYYQGPADANGDHLPDNPRFKVYKIRRDSSVWTSPSKPECARHDSTLHFADWQSWKNEAVVDGAPLDESGNPLLLGDETLWAVFNDGGPHTYDAYGGGTDPLGVEVHQTVWGSSDPGEENVVYVKYKLYNKSPNVIDSFYISFWVDPDLGGAGDDLVGCDSTYDLFFCYNAGASDDVYGDVPPAWGGKLLYGPVVPSPGDTAIFDGNLMPGFKNIRMSSFNKYINGTDPDVPAQLYGYMKGFNAVEDCPSCPYTDPTSGNITRFPFAGDPITGQGWLDKSPADRRLMANFGPVTFNPGDSQQVVLKLAAYAEENRLYSLSKLRNILDPNCPVAPVSYVACNTAEAVISDYHQLCGVFFNPANECWLTGVNWGGDFFGGGVDYGWNFWGGYLNPTTMADSFVAVELRFTDNDPEAGQRAYNYCRGCDPNYSYQGYFRVPFQAWDIDNDRQLNVCFIEWNESSVYDYTWGPDTTAVGGREYFYVMRSTYDGDNAGDAGSGPIDYTTADFYDGSAFDFLYAGWLRVMSDHDISEMTDQQKLIFEYQSLNENGPTDSIVFREAVVGGVTSQKADITCSTSQRSIIKLSLSDTASYSVSHDFVDLADGESWPVVIYFNPQHPGRYEDSLYLVDSISGSAKAQIKLVGYSPIEYGLQGITISPSSVDTIPGDSCQFTAMGTYVDPIDETELTEYCTWHSSDIFIGSVSTGGLVRCLQPGVCTITASIFGYSDSASLTVKPVLIEASNPLEAPAGASCTLVVDCNFSPDSVTMYYRLGGDADDGWRSTGTSQLRGAFQGVIPADDIGLRGAEYYFRAYENGASATLPDMGAGEYPFVLRVAVENMAGSAVPEKLFRMIGFPFEVDPAGFAQVFEDDLGEFQEGAWKVGRWNPATERYIKNYQVGTIERKQGYWIWSSTEISAGASGSSAVPDTVVNDIPYAKLVLEPGWNQISTPFAFSIIWNGRIAEDGIESQLWEYISGNGPNTTYDITGLLEPFVGYWARNDSSTSKILLLPYRTGGGVFSISKKLEFVGDNGWHVRLSLESDGVCDRTNIIGYAPDARDGRDRYDFSEPPVIDRFVSLGFVQKRENGKTNLLAGDFRPMPDGGTIYDILIRGNTGRPAQIEISRTQDLPVGYRIILEEPESGGSYELKDGYSLTIPHLPTEAGIRYRLIVGSKEYIDLMNLEPSLMPDEFALEQNYPNPFNPITNISFALPVPADVNLDVFNILGQKVKTLIDAPMPAGRHAVSWDGTGSGGHPVASGIYFYRLKAARFAQTRKMILLK